MKKIFGVICAAMLVFGLSGQALAAYDLGTLVQFIYEGTTDAGNEFNTGLGSVKTGDLTSRTIIAGQPAVDLSDFVTGDWDDLYVGFTSQFSETWVNPGDAAYKKNKNTWVWMTTTTPDVPNIAFDQFLTFSGNANAVVATTPTGGQAKSAPVSYWEKIETYAGTNYQGAYAGFNYADRVNGFASLGILDDDLTTGDDTGSAVIDRYVELYLWQYKQYDPFVGDTQEGFVNAAGAFADTFVAKLKIGIQDDGAGGAQIATSVVPIPAAAWLLGSGLLGLMGLRHRRNGHKTN